MFGAEAVFWTGGNVLRIIGDIPAEKDDTVPNKAIRPTTTVRARGDYECHPHGRSVAHFETFRQFGAFQYLSFRAGNRKRQVSGLCEMSTN